MIVSQPAGARESQGKPQSMRQPREQLEQADQLRQLGQLDRAESICHALTQRHPDFVAALHTLGLVYLDKRNFERALDCLVRAQMLDPNNWMILTALSLAYLRLGANEMAAQTLDRALAIRPEDASTYASLGEIYREEREYELAQYAYRKALTLDSGLESAAIGLALCHLALGQNSEAARVLEDAFRRGNRSLNLLDVMATLPRNTLSIDLLAALDVLSVSQREQDAEFKNTFAFVRAAALHMADRYGEAWKLLEAANRPLFAEHKSQLKEDNARQEKSLARLRSVSFKPVGTSKAPVSLFILGASRSGKSSLEHLLGALDGVKTGCEVPIVENALRRAFQSAAFPASQNLEDLPPELLPSFRDYYLEDLTRRAGSTKVFTNTLSQRIHDASIIASVIPNVRFVFLRRDLQDTALRIYMTKYLRGNSYAYDLKSIAGYLQWYNHMIDLAAEKFSEIALLVTYESMIADPLTVLRKIATMCGLSIKDGPIPALVDDRGVATHYREFMGDYEILREQI
jgi:Flp pilus assembly protein TadD